MNAPWSTGTDDIQFNINQKRKSQYKISIFIKMNFVKINGNTDNKSFT